MPEWAQSVRSRSSVIRVCVAAVVASAAAAMVLCESHVADAATRNDQSAIPPAKPGTLIGPTRAKSVSFLVSLRSATRPTCVYQWADSAQLSVQWSVGQPWASISGPPRNVDRSLHISIDDYRTPNGKVVFAADHSAPVPPLTCGEVSGVGSIHSFVPPTNFDVRPGGATSGDLLRAYDALPLKQSGFQGQGETVVLLESEGGYLQGDLTKFDADEHLPDPPDLAPESTNNGFQGETTMDIETVHEIAPQAHLVFLNVPQSTTTSTPDLFAQAFGEIGERWPGAIVSVSLGVCETYFNSSDLIALNSAIASVEAKGGTVFASSGDTGGFDCTPDDEFGQPPANSFVGVEIPASLPAVTGVGGTSLTTDASGNYVGETTWSEPLLSQGSAGGVSQVLERPAWQTGVGTGGQADTNNGREVPDVSADADPATGNFLITKGSESTGGGTSLATPIWAGFTALIDQYLASSHDPPVGFFNAILYQLADSSVPYPPFHDITVGGNDLYLATPGYDMVTGLGSPNVYNLARDLKAGGA
jgi:kumamolisin